jgi:phospholipase C
MKGGRAIEPYRPMNVRLTGFAIAVAAMLGAAACAGHAGSMPPAPLPTATQTPVVPIGNFIKHVVIIVQENRSFDNIFANFPGTGRVTGGYGICSPADETKCGPQYRHFIHLHPVSFTDAKGDMDHLFDIALVNYDHGKMDGFDDNTFGTTGGDGAVGDYPYTFLVRSEVKPYWTMAQQYVLGDRMFPGEFGPSFTAHQYLIAGTTMLDPQTALVDTPESFAWGCDSIKPNPTSILVSGSQAPLTAANRKEKVFGGPFPCLTQYTTMADTLDAAHVRWRYYAPSTVPETDLGGQVWSAFDAIKNVRYNPMEWTKTGNPAGSGVSWPPTNVLRDTNAGHLPSVAWVIPDLINSDQPAAASANGPAWVSTIVNAIGKSKDWKSTAIVVVWDEWGAWYDNVPPPQLDYAGLGIRTPVLIISPYVHPHVDHTQYEYGSILKFVEQVFGVAPLGGHATDARSNSLVNAFDFTMKPRPFTPIPLTVTPQYFFDQPPSLKPPDPD